MIDGYTVLAIIPARGGSKGVPRKNIRVLAGKPLIAWTIEEAKRSVYIDRFILTSEDPEVIDVATLWGCEAPFVRPSELAQDDTPGMAPVLHALRQMPPYDLVVLLQPTSPLRTAADIDRCVEACVRSGAPSCVTMAEAEKSPFWMYVLDEARRMQPVLPREDAALPRQKLPKVYALNGAVYVAWREWLLKSEMFVGPETVASVMPHERSLDIDTELDCMFFEFLMSAARRKSDEASRLPAAESGKKP